MIPKFESQRAREFPGRVGADVRGRPLLITTLYVFRNTDPGIDERQSSDVNSKYDLKG